MESSFEARIVSLSSVIPKMRNLGNRVISTLELIDIITDYCNRINTGYIMELVDFNQSEFKHALLYEKDNNAYMFLLNNTLSYIEQWYAIAHDLAHLLFHRDYINIQMAQESYRFEEEADFFAQLTIWPINAIFSDLLRSKETLRYSELINFLVKYAYNELSCKMESKSSDMKIRQNANRFFERMKIFLPNMYQKIMVTLTPLSFDDKNPMPENIR
jgi:hypothetical protein